jgi:hypothetical protein
MSNKFELNKTAMKPPRKSVLMSGTIVFAGKSINCLAANSGATIEARTPWARSSAKVIF